MPSRGLQAVGRGSGRQHRMFRWVSPEVFKRRTYKVGCVFSTARSLCGLLEIQL
jgi:hypothetical protein